jgi:hypothetical protein
MEYYGYGTFCKGFVDSGSKPPKKAPWAIISKKKKKKQGKFGPIYYGYYGILRNITVHNISPILLKVLTN